MPAPPSECGSDFSDEPSSVLLALPDGPIAADASDGKSHTTSLVGGYPTFPAGVAVPEAVNCGACHTPMPLLSQVYCPLVDGENDRTLYVWACPKTKCRRRDGSIRAFRASVRNEEYVADVEAKRAEAERIAQEEREKARINPFTVKDAPAGGNLFGGAAPLFGAAPSNPFAAPAPEPETEATSSPTAAVAALTLGEPTTLAPPLPAYQPAQYLTTVDEYLPPPESDDDIDSDDDADEKTAEAKAAWRGDDGWDKLLPKGVDDIFEKFVRRVQGAEDADTQVLRYDFGAMPLPYSSSSALFKKLFPKAPVRGLSSEDEEVDLAEYYTTAWIPKCANGKCKGKRVFEAQLVPQLINVLRPSALSTTGAAPEKKKATKLSEDERRAELARLAKGEGETDSGEMEWGTIMVFSCDKDCVGLVEEYVGVEWEASVSLQAQQLHQ